MIYLDIWWWDSEMHAKWLIKERQKWQIQPIWLFICLPMSDTNIITIVIKTLSLPLIIFMMCAHTCPWIRCRNDSDNYPWPWFGYTVITAEPGKKNSWFCLNSKCSLYKSCKIIIKMFVNLFEPPCTYVIDDIKNGSNIVN